MVFMSFLMEVGKIEVYYVEIFFLNLNESLMVLEIRSDGFEVYRFLELLFEGVDELGSIFFVEVFKEIFIEGKNDVVVVIEDVRLLEIRVDMLIIVRYIEYVSIGFFIVIFFF